MKNPGSKVHCVHVKLCECLHVSYEKKIRLDYCIRVDDMERLPSVCLCVIQFQFR